MMHHAAAVEPDELPTGVPGLDRILCGGLRRPGMYLIVGNPGAGKTVLAHQIGFRHARDDAGVLYLTALVESHETLLSQAGTFDFFSPGVVGRTFYYASLHAALERGGLTAAREEIARLVAERSVRLVVLDGLHVLHLAAESELAYQRFLNELQGFAAVTGTVLLLVANYERAGPSDPTFTVADGILRLWTESAGRRTIRNLEVVKMRGRAHVQGSHVFRIAGEGVHIYPRFEAIALAEGLPPSMPAEARRRFGIPGLDAMLGGGVASASATMLAGTPGAGKTLLALAFLAEGARADESGVFLGFHETPDRLVAKAGKVGIPLSEAVDGGKVRLLWRPSAELLADELAEELIETVEGTGARRVVIDGLTDLRRAFVVPDRMIGFLNTLTDLLRARGIGLLLTQEVRQIFSLDLRLPLEEVSAAVDHILLLRYIELQSRLQRMVSILKMRDTDYDAAIRELEFGHGRIRVGEPFAHAELLLTGLARLARAEDA